MESVEVHHEGWSAGGSHGMEQRLRGLFSVSLDMLGVADMEGRFRELSPSWEKTLGYTRAELYARPYIDFVHPDDRESTLDAAGRLARGAPAVSFQNRYRAKDGSYRWIEWCSSPDVEQGCIYFVARDVTERKQAQMALEESEKRLRASLDRAEDYARELERQNAMLEREVMARAQAEMQMTRYRSALDAAITPILQLWKGVLAVPVIGTLDERRAAELTERLLFELGRLGGRYIILDLTGVEDFDASVSEHIVPIVRAIRLMGGRCVLSGITFAVAKTLISLDNNAMSELATFGTLQQALGHALAQAGAGRGGGGRV
jgi:PAS domain S-box-containing protein